MNQTSSEGSGRTEPTRITPFGVLLKTIGIVIIIAILLLSLAAFVPPLFHYQTANIISGSMAPEIPVDSYVLASEGNYEELEPGQIIMFDLNGTTVTHRVVSNDPAEWSVVTKGDANEREDMHPVSYSQITGIVRFHMPLLGKVLHFISGLTGKLCALGVLVVGALLVFAGSHMRRRAK